MNHHPSMKKKQQPPDHVHAAQISNADVDLSWSGPEDYFAAIREVDEVLAALSRKRQEVGPKDIRSDLVQEIFRDVAAQIDPSLLASDPLRITVGGSHFANAFLRETNRDYQLLNEAVGDRLYVLDTTLRDGALDHMKKLSIDDKVFVISELTRLGVDVIEVGDSKQDMQAISRFGSSQQGNDPPVISVAVGSDPNHVVAKIETLGKMFLQGGAAAIPQKSRRLHLYFPTSNRMRQERGFLNNDDDQFFDHVTNVVTRACKAGFVNIQVSAQDATRSEIDFLTKFFQTAIEVVKPQSGQRFLALNIADTLGEASPRYAGWIVRKLKEAIPLCADSLVLSYHGHGDLGMGHACAFTAIENGARQIEATVAGIGPRVGNVPLEEIISSLHVHDYMNLKTRIKLDKVSNACKTILAVIGMGVAATKPIIGSKAFMESVDEYAVGRNFPIHPEDIGAGKCQVFTKLPRWDTLAKLLKDKGVTLLQNDQRKKLYEALKKVFADKEQITDTEILAMAFQLHREQTSSDSDLTWRLVELNVTSSAWGKTERGFARVVIERGFQKVEEVASECGSISAVFAAIARAVGIKVDIVNYRMDVLIPETNKQASVTVVLKDEREPGNPACGSFTSHDVVHASAAACLQAVNVLLERIRQRSATSTPSLGVLRSSEEDGQNPPRIISFPDVSWGNL